MKNWKVLLKLNLIIILNLILIILSISKPSFSNEIYIEIRGNDYTDEIAITSSPVFTLG